MKREAIDKLVSDALAIEAEDAQKAGQLGFMARILVQATMPHSHTDAQLHERVNGNFRLSMVAGSSTVGLPYGAIPRLLLAWLATEAVRTQDRHLTLGDSLSDFMRKLDMVPTGGRWGSITRLRDQSQRLFGCMVTAAYERDGRGRTATRFTLADSDDLWWTPASPDQRSLWQSTVSLSERFFDEVSAAPVPIDLRALKALRRSPMALDLYCWLTYRMHTVKRPTVISWAGLQAQFGAGYPETPQGLRDFRKKLLQHLRSVLVVYSDARVEQTDAGLRLSPSRPHIGKRRERLSET